MMNLKLANSRKFIAWYVLVVLIYNVWFLAFYNMVAYQQLLPYPDVAAAVSAIAKNFITISAVFMANTAIIFFLTSRWKMPLKLLYDTVLSFVAVVLLSMLAKVVIEGIGATTDFDWAGIMLNDMIILLFNEVAYLAYAFYRSRQKAEAAERNALQLQYDVLKSQVDPHFLFNSLNILYSMSVIDIAKTREFILSLSQMYRYILTQHNNHSVKLSEELTFLQSYIDVLENRYRGSLKFEITGMENVANHEIIPYSTQLLIENVTKHNVVQADAPMTVTIDIGPEELTITNPIRRKKNVTSSRIGLRYLSQLYSAAGKQFRHTDHDGMFVAHVPYL